MKYHFSGAKDATAAKRILADVDLERAKRIVDAYLDSDDGWLTERGKTLGILASGAQLPKFIASTAGAESTEPLASEPPVFISFRERFRADVDANLDSLARTPVCASG